MADGTSITIPEQCKEADEALHPKGQGSGQAMPYKAQGAADINLSAAFTIKTAAKTDRAEIQEDGENALESFKLKSMQHFHESIVHMPLPAFCIILITLVRVKVAKKE